MTNPDRLRARIAELEEDTRFSDKSAEELYMMALKDSEPGTDEAHPGAAEEFHERWIEHKIRTAAEDANRGARFGDNP